MIVCKNCNWTGLTEELEAEKVETCMGNDMIPICPVCGSYDIVHSIIK